MTDEQFKELKVYLEHFKNNTPTATAFSELLERLSKIESNLKQLNETLKKANFPKM
ncbi:MAG TPA: hypothetical protein VG738_13190 [Chitinophagaceae bacterium]|nr:hypothetical protein [Chitinophagaceae bacterium]